MGHKLQHILYFYVTVGFSTCTLYVVHSICPSLVTYCISIVAAGTLGMILRSSKRLYMRIFYSLVDDMQRYFTLKTINFTSMDEDKGALLPILLLSYHPNIYCGFMNQAPFVHIHDMWVHAYIGL